MTSSGTLSDSILFIGPPGMGKTTLARLATTNELVTRVGGEIRATRDAVEAVGRVRRGDVLFIDEIHSARKLALEGLYSVMEDGVIFDFGRAHDISHVQVMAATTEPGKMPQPLRDRFGITIYLRHYTDDEILRILTRSTKVMQSRATEEMLGDIADRSRGVPRIANKLLRRAIDFAGLERARLERAQFSPLVQLTASCLTELWDVLEVDSKGLDRLDREVLQVLATQTRPMGVNTIARNIGLDKSSIETIVEPFLLRLGFVEIVPGGRQITVKGITHLGRSSS
jgi:holliday junction DNA helicase RuvB